MKYPQIMKTALAAGARSPAQQKNGCRAGIIFNGVNGKVVQNSVD